MLYLFSMGFILMLIILMYYFNFLNNQEYLSKSDVFECGFNSLNNPNAPFNMPFFYICLMFLIFDLELALLIFYPLLNTLKNLYVFTFTVLMLILLLTFYEWEKNLINWF